MSLHFRPWQECHIYICEERPRVTTRPSLRSRDLVFTLYGAYLLDRDGLATIGPNALASAVACSMGLSDLICC